MVDYKMCRIKSFQSPLEGVGVVALRTCSGKLFHDFVAATQKALSPNFKRVLGTWKSDFVAERRTVPRDVSEETGCRRSVMYVGALPMTVRWTRRHSLNCIRASTGSQCSSIAAAEIWSRGRRPHTSLMAALRARCSGAMVVYGSSASRALQ